jgi:hypothetical protein
MPVRKVGVGRMSVGGEAEIAEDRRRARQAAARQPKISGLVAELEREVVREGASGHTTSQAWSEKLRSSFGYDGGTWADTRGELNPGLADAVLEADGPRLWYVRGERVDVRGGERRWMRTPEVGEDGYRRGWEVASHQALDGLRLDASGTLTWEDGTACDVDEAAARGPAVEMAVRARMRMGDVPVEHCEPYKSDAKRVNVLATSRLLDSVSTWVARIGAEVVYSLDGTLTKVTGEESEWMVAAWAAVTNEGECTGGHLPASERDNYMTEMAAQLSVARAKG